MQAKKKRKGKEGHERIIYQNKSYKIQASKADPLATPVTNFIPGFQWTTLFSKLEAIRQ